MGVTFSHAPDNSEVKFAQGDDIQVPILFSISGTPIVLTGYTFNSYLEVPDETGTITQLPITIVVQNQTLDPGVLVLSLTAAQTALLAGAYRWLFTWVDLDSKFRTIIDGTWTVAPND